MAALSTLPGVSVLSLPVVACLMTAWIDRFVFFPDREMPPPPPGIEERWFTTPDGEYIHAWYAEAAPDSPLLLWSHGNGGNIAGRVQVQVWLRDRGVSVLAYDYRGYGKSSGRPSEAGLYTDVLAVYDGLRAAGVSPERIIAFGESLGGAVAIYLATQRPCAAAAVVSTFTTMRDVARFHFGPLAFAAGGRFDSLQRVGALAVPIFIAHGEQDDIVPLVLGKRLYAAAREPKSFLGIPGAYHNDVFASARLLDGIAAFAKRAVTGET